MCTCDAQNGVDCRDITCDGNASCIVDQEGSGVCVCNEPDFVGDGFFCTNGTFTLYCAVLSILWSIMWRRYLQKNT